jgi:hypothetical protein
VIGRATTVDSRPELGPDEVDFRWLSENWERVHAWGSRHQLSREWIVLVGANLVAIIIALWLTSAAWGPRPISGEDTMAHIVRADFAFRHLISHGRIDGWDPSFILGYQEFLFIGPGFTWAVALLHAGSLGALSITGAVKVVSIASFVIAPCTVAFVARSFGLSRRSAGLAAVLSLAVNNPFGGAGLQGLFNVGLLPHQFAALFFFVALGSSVRVLRGQGLRWVMWTALATAGLLVSHGISVIIFAAMLGVVLLASSPRVPSVQQWRDQWSAMVRRAVVQELRRMGLLADEPGELPERVDNRPEDRASPQAVMDLIVALAVAGALGACVLLPFVGHRDLRGIFTAWGTPPLGTRFSQIWRGQILYQPRVALLILVGMVYGLVRVLRGDRYALPVLATPLLYVVGSHVVFHLWSGNVITPQLTNRGLGYAGVLAVLPLAALIAKLTLRFGLLGDLLAVSVAAAVVLVPVTPYRRYAKETAEPVPQLREAAGLLHTLVPEGARFVTQRDFPGEITRTKVVDPDRWLAWASGRPTLDNFNVESSQNPGPAYESEHVVDRPPATLADAISKLGVTHLVTVSDAGAAHVAGSPRFVEIWRSSPIAIFAVVAPEGQPPPGALLAGAAPVDATMAHAAPEHLTIDVRASQAMSATVAIGWSPKWHARLDGHSVALTKGPDGLLALAVPAGGHRLQLDFRSDAWDAAGLIVTVMTILLGGYWVVRFPGRRLVATEAATPPGPDDAPAGRTSAMAVPGVDLRTPDPGG